MKRIVPLVLVLVVPLALTLSGCATLADKVGIANKAYADQKAAEAEEKAAADVQALRTELTDQLQTLKQDADAVQKALAEVDEVVASTSQLKDLAKAFEQRLTTLPEETLRGIVQILQAYLDSKQ